MGDDGLQEERTVKHSLAFPTLKIPLDGCRNYPQVILPVFYFISSVDPYSSYSGPVHNVKRRRMQHAP